MGLFHKYLTDALAALERDDLEAFDKIIEEHFDKHVSRSVNGIIYRLRELFKIYFDNLGWMRYEYKSMYKSKNKEEMKAALKEKVVETIEILGGIKKSIKKLLKEERIKLE